jgi:hypothetical protein
MKQTSCLVVIIQFKTWYSFIYTVSVPSFLVDFEIIPIEAVKGQIYGVRGQSLLLGEGIG